MEKILLAHGNGGRYTQQLVTDIFQHYLGNEMLNKMNDASIFPSPGEKLAFTTDSFVVSPLTFPGGDIGKLAVCGTVNDLAVSGAQPLYLSTGFIIEEGLPVKLLQQIVASMAETVKHAGVKVITGDTKVVPKGQADKLFINTSGIGVIPSTVNMSCIAQPGDKVIINGTIGDHGMAIMAARAEFNMIANFKSDCAPLNQLIAELLKAAPQTRVLRDPTRGGVATTLNELAVQSNVGISLNEESLPVNGSVKSTCEILGLDPLYLANEGKVIAIVPEDSVDKAMSVLKGNPLGQNAAVIGQVVKHLPGKVYMKTALGSKRLVDTLVSDQLPRIC